jgi:hypothetical protein
MMDDPEVTIEPADNGYIVRHCQRSTKKDEGGRTIRRVASTAEEALGYAGRVLGSKTSKKKSGRDGGAVAEEAPSETAPAHSSHSSHHSARSASRRHRPRTGGRR